MSARLPVVPILVFIAVAFGLAWLVVLPLWREPAGIAVWKVIVVARSAAIAPTRTTTMAASPSARFTLGHLLGPRRTSSRSWP